MISEMLVPTMNCCYPFRLSSLTIKGGNSRRGSCGRTLERGPPGPLERTRIQNPQRSLLNPNAPPGSPRKEGRPPPSRQLKQKNRNTPRGKGGTRNDRAPRSERPSLNGNP